MHLCGLRGVRIAVNAEVVSGLGHAEILEEDLAHRAVVVLTGMDERLIEHDVRADPAVCCASFQAVTARITGATFMKFGRVAATSRSLAVIGMRCRRQARVLSGRPYTERIQSAVRRMPSSSE